jgi:quercetin dioxygenase-like cupin family protein
MRPLRVLGFALVSLSTVASASVLGCRNERTRTLVGPPLIADTPDGEADASDAFTPEDGGADASEATTPARSPVTATFVDLSKRGAPITISACEQLFVAVVKGKATALGETLGEGDVLAARGQKTFDVKGDGLALVAAVEPRICEPDQARMNDKRVVRDRGRKELTFAGGAMHVKLDVEEDVSQLAYLGRLHGTAPVAEHVHDGSWEVLAAVDAEGTFTLNGIPQRLAPRQIVTVPPNTRHAWQPDEGSILVALQLYAPPGPEQRFKALAGATGATDAGARPDAHR